MAAACSGSDLPKPSEDQISHQDLEMYAFLHFSLNTFTDQEWGYGNENPEIFNPTHLDARQWARTCRDAGMKGIIFTAKHHCGFCMWPTAYTDYSVKSSRWKNGEGDVVRELADACREYGLKLGIYLSPWDRHRSDFGSPEYIDYFRSQLRELLSGYGDIFEVWFDGAYEGDGWYGGADEMRIIDPYSYYCWEDTFKIVRELQPHCIIWNDRSNIRADIRWVGNEAGFIGETNWSLLNSTGEVEWTSLHYGFEDGDVWVPGETNTSIRPGWFYHSAEDDKVKSLTDLMTIYYKSVGRNSMLLLNFPITPDGLIHPADSLRGTEFNREIHKIFDHPIEAKTKTGKHTCTLTFKEPTEFNRLMICEDIRYGQRVKSFKVEALVNGQWCPLEDTISEEPDRSMTTIGRKRILCFPTTVAERIRLTILDSKATPVISSMSAYLAADEPLAAGD